MQTLTIFTPTYNREDKLLRLYLSLAEQTNKDFEWLVVDDGSTDKTREIIEGFPVRQIIIWKRKGGINFNPGYFLPTYEVGFG